MRKRDGHKTKQKGRHENGEFLFFFFQNNKRKRKDGFFFFYFYLSGNRAKKTQNEPNAAGRSSRKTNKREKKHTKIWRWFSFLFSFDTSRPSFVICAFPIFSRNFLLLLPVCPDGREKKRSVIGSHVITDWNHLSINPVRRRNGWSPFVTDWIVKWCGACSSSSLDVTRIRPSVDSIMMCYHL